MRLPRCARGAVAAALRPALVLFENAGHAAPATLHLPYSSCHVAAALFRAVVLRALWLVSTKSAPTTKAKLGEQERSADL